jgi:hypothetical protein
MKRTLIVHSKEAESDIVDWLKKKGKEATYWPVIEVELKNEVALIIEKTRLTKNFHCDKLVLFGSFTELDLSKIVRFIKFT